MVLAACASREPAAAAPVAPTPAVRAEASTAPVPVATSKVVDASAIYARVRFALEACYAAGLRATPEMADAKVTLDASFDGRGTATCAVPRDDSGFTQDVVDCMARALAVAALEGAPHLVTLPVVARSGALALGAPRADTAAIESVETVRMPDAFDVLDALESPLAACVHGKGASAKSMIVAARVGASGTPECTLATSAGALPAAASECAANVLRNAKFPAPKKGSGFIVIPLLLQ